MKRRSFVKGTLSAGAVGLAAGAGLISPAAVLAEGFNMATVDSATASADIKLKVPEVAENGAVVPVTVDASAIDGVTAISIVAANNPQPLAATFNLGEGAKGFAGTRIKMGKSGKVIALVTAGGKTMKAEKEVKVTIGGCGG